MTDVVDHRITDGRRIAQLLASELDGRTDSGLSAVSVANADRDVEPTPAGARAYDVTHSTGEHAVQLATVFVHPDRARVAFERTDGIDQSPLTIAAEERELTVEPSSNGDRDDIWIDDGAAVKRVTDVVTRLLKRASVD